MATLLEQAIESQKAEIARLEALQVQYDNAANALSPQYSAARRALRDAQADPNTPPARLAQLQNEFDQISEKYSTARDNASANLARLQDMKDALASNEAKVNDPNQNISQQVSNQDPAAAEAEPQPEPEPQVQDTELSSETDPGIDPPLEEPPGTPKSLETELSNEDDPGIPVENSTVLPDQEPSTVPTATGLQGQVAQTRQQATAQDQYNYAALEDWRVRLRLAPGAEYLYKAPDPGILAPLAMSDGVIFPYTPQISVQYSANYDPQEITHSNYKIFQYRSSGVDTITITCDFTAQDVYEANYMLAVIHFFKSATKMFYGKDQNPVNGTPPPLCYLYGLGEFQFNKHPLAITGFTYNLPNEVDYIRASVTEVGSEMGKQAQSTPSIRTSSSRIMPGGLPMPPQWALTKGNGAAPGSVQPTYVPTKMQMQITCIPIVSRADITQNFSLCDYATGQLLLGSKREGLGGGIW